jgi:hypothetical protein
MQDDYAKGSNRRQANEEMEDDNRTSTTHESLTSLVEVFPGFSRDQPGKLICAHIWLTLFTSSINCNLLDHSEMSIVPRKDFSGDLNQLKPVSRNWIYNNRNIFNINVQCM